MLNDFLQRGIGDEAHISGTRRWLRRLRLELLAPLVPVDLPRTEGQRLASLSESDHFHPQHAGIESARRVDAADGQHDIVERNDSHCSTPGRGLERSDELAAYVPLPK